MASLRPRGADDLGLRRVLPGRLLGLTIGTMVFLAALALGAASGMAALADHWRLGAASLLTVEVPQPAAPAGHSSRAAMVAGRLGAMPALRVTRLEGPPLAALLRPWLGADPATIGVDLPAVFAVRLRGPDPGPALDRALAAVAPGTVVSRNADWLRRLAVLAGSLRACAALALALVGGVAAVTVAVATHGALGATRQAVEILHGLGAADGAIAGRFAWRTGGLAVAGGVPGAVLALPVLLFLGRLAAPFAGAGSTGPGLGLWIGLALLPAAAAAIGWATAYLSVRQWLLRLP